MWKKISIIAVGMTLLFSACASIQAPATPGGQVIRETPTKSGQASDLLTASGDSHEVVVHWQRSGGFAGICQEMDIYADAHAIVKDCGTDRILASGDLPEQERLMLKDWLETYGQFNWKFNPPKGSADMFIDQYTISGVGDQRIPALQEENINQDLAGIAQVLLQQPTQ